MQLVYRTQPAEFVKVESKRTANREVNGSFTSFFTPTNQLFFSCFLVKTRKTFGRSF